jgi:hypothetical protein
MMRKMKFLFVLGILLTTAFAQQAIQINDVAVAELENDLLRITVEVENISQKSIGEISGVIDILDNYGKTIDKKELSIVSNHDMPLESGKSRERSIVVTQRPNMSGNAHYRVTNLRFFGEQAVYMVCPNCNEIIPKE